MSDEVEAPAPEGVSPLRKNFSVGILLALVVVLGIELRASLGQKWSGTALQAAAPENGVFDEDSVSPEALEGMLSLGPSKTMLRESDTETEYRYSWFSLLRPILGRQESAVYVVYDRNDPPTAIRYGTEAPEDFEMNPNEATEVGEVFEMPDASGEAGDQEGGHDATGGGDEATDAEKQRPPVDDDEAETPAEPNEADTPPEPQV